MDNNQDQQDIIPDEQQQDDFSSTPGITYVDSPEIADYMEVIKQYQIDKKRFSFAFLPAIFFFIVTIFVSATISDIIRTYYSNGLLVEQELTFTITSMLITHIITLLISVKLLKEKLFAPIIVKPIKPKLAFLTVLFALGAGRLAEIGTTPLYQLFPVVMDSERYYSSPQSSILFLILLAIIPAIFEEWLLRGIVLKHLLPHGKWTAIFVSSAIFGMMHTHPGQAVFAFVFGIMLGIIYINSGGNIWLCVIVHFLNNAIAFTQGYFLANEFTDAAYNWLAFLTYYSTIIITIIILFYYVFKAKKPFFLPIGETAEDSYDLKPKTTASIIFKNGSTYVYLFISIAIMILALSNRVA